MRVAPIISSFYIQNFAKDITEPYTSLQAYKSGLIDENGNYTGQESSVEPYEYFVIKLKKIFEQVPYGPTRSTLTYYLPALKYFTEEISWYGVDPNIINMFLEGWLSAQTGGPISLLEDMGTGGGAGAIGVPADAPGANKGGVSGFDPVMGKVQKRKELPGFFNLTQMFEADPETWEGFKNAETWRHVPPGPTANYLKRFKSRNPSAKLAVKNSETGAIHWLNYK